MEFDNRTYTKGDVIVEEIRVGDTHYEIEHMLGLEVEVVTLPKRSESGAWYWDSKHKATGRIIHYIVHPDYNHYAPKLYTFKAYEGIRYV